MSARGVDRTVLILGPPNSGKTIFAFLLCEELRRLGNEAAIVECDYFSFSVRAIISPNSPQDKP